MYTYSQMRIKENKQSYTIYGNKLVSLGQKILTSIAINQYNQENKHVTCKENICIFICMFVWSNPFY